jgi:hypothetical protein
MLTLAWSPPSDELDPRWVGFELLRADGNPGSGARIADLKIRGASIELAIPTLAEPDGAWTGPALLRFLGPAAVEPAQGPCPVHACSVDLDFDVPSLPIAITQ